MSNTPIDVIKCMHINQYTTAIEGTFIIYSQLRK